MIDLSTAPKQQTERYKAPVVSNDPVEAFLFEMSQFGLTPGVVDLSGDLIRFDVDKKGDKAGWYVFYTGDVYAGAFGNWKNGEKRNWCQYESSEMSDDQAAEYKQMVANAREKRKAEEARLHEAARIKANEIWGRSSLVDGHHPYLEKKKVSGEGLRASLGDLVIPIKDPDGIIHNLQFIKPDESKKFLFGGRVDGLSFTIPGDGRLMICEGYATGASIHKATCATVICAFNAGNLPAVARAVRGRCPTSFLTICADNDRFTPGNPGISKANEAAKATGATVVFPVFDGIPGGDDPDRKLTDFNDLAAVAGADAVKIQITQPGGRGKLPPLTEIGSRVSGRLLSRPKPIDFIFKYNDQGLIPRGVVGVLTATGGTGKTFFLLHLAMAGATGGNFGPIRAPKPLKTLVIIGEDTQDELDRRLWDIGKGQFPDNLHAVSVYGELGPFMRIDGSTPVYADAYYWLEETIKNHPGLDLLIIDPKSRFYGLDENSSEHSTQWIAALEGLSKRHELTILFSHHTSKDTAGKISQNMSRGSSAIVDGCRWQGGLARMDGDTAAMFGISNPRDYILFDAPKSNYAADLPGVICFHRGDGGILEYCEPGRDRLELMAEQLLDLLGRDPQKYSANDLIKKSTGESIAKEMKDRFSTFSRRTDMKKLIDWLVSAEKLHEIEECSSEAGRPRAVLSTAPF